MARVSVELDFDGVREVLQSPEVVAQVGDLGRRVAAAARSGGVPSHMPVTVEAYVTDRAAVSVGIEHYAGVGLEAKHGYLARAAAACGLEVRRR